MIRKLIILIILIIAAIVFYNTFLADTFEPFFRQFKGNVDFFQQKIPDYKVKE